jgi:prevent-host-death family protein
MKIINYTEAKTNLRKTLDECERTSEPVCIVSRNNQMVVISKAQYEMMINQINGVK